MTEVFGFFTGLSTIFLYIIKKGNFIRSPPWEEVKKGIIIFLAISLTLLGIALTLESTWFGNLVGAALTMIGIQFIYRAIWGANILKNDSIEQPNFIREEFLTQILLLCFNSLEKQGKKEEAEKFLQEVKNLAQSGGLMPERGVERNNPVQEESNFTGVISLEQARTAYAKQWIAFEIVDETCEPLLGKVIFNNKDREKLGDDIDNSGLEDLYILYMNTQQPEYLNKNL